MVRVPEYVISGLRWKYSGLFDPQTPEVKDEISKWRQHANWFASGFLLAKGSPRAEEARQREATNFGYAYAIHVMSRGKGQNRLPIDDCWEKWQNGESEWIGVAF